MQILRLRHVLPFFSKFWVVREMFYFITRSICSCTAVCSIFFIRQKVLYIIKKKFENRKDVPFPLEKAKNKPSLFLKNARNKKKQELMFFSLAVREISTKTLWMLILPSLTVIEVVNNLCGIIYCYRPNIVRKFYVKIFAFFDV